MCRVKSCLIVAAKGFDLSSSLMSLDLLEQVKHPTTYHLTNTAATDAWISQK